MQDQGRIPSPVVEPVMTVWILRTLASLFCSFLIISAATLLFTTLAISLATRPGIYAQALVQQGAYDRLHSEVLQPLLDAEARRLNPETMYMLPREDVAGLLEDLAPPEFLREQTENNLDRLSGYISGDREPLRLYLDFSEPLQRLAPTKEFPREIRKSAASLSIEDPRVGRNIELDGHDRLELSPLLAPQATGFADVEFQWAADGWRGKLLRAQSGGRAIALAGLLAPLGLLAMFHWREPKRLGLWAGWTLATGGLFLLAATLLSPWLLLGGVREAVAQWLTETQQWPPELALLVTDVAGQALKNLLVGMTWLAAIPLVAGSLLLAASSIRESPSSWERWKSDFRKLYRASAKD